MRWSELSAKELVNTYDGSRMGLLGDADLVISPNTGKIMTVVMQPKGWFGTRSQTEMAIPWSQVRKIGEDMVLIDAGRRSRR